MTTKSRNTSGNMLLIVLIGIALFAALSFVITRENHYDTGSSENATLQAQLITSYAEKINGTVQNLMLQNHCLLSQISFTSSASKCAIFDQTGVGGGVAAQTPPTAAVDTVSFAAAGSPSATQAGTYIFEGNLCVTNTGTACGAGGGSALVFIMPWVTKAVCAQINQITANSTTIPTIATQTFDGTAFTGSFAGAASNTITTTGTTNTSGCFYSTFSTPGTGYHYYSVLQAN